MLFSKSFFYHLSNCKNTSITFLLLSEQLIILNMICHSQQSTAECTRSMSKNHYHFYLEGIAFSGPLLQSYFSDEIARLKFSNDLFCSLSVLAFECSSKILKSEQFWMIQQRRTLALVLVNVTPFLFCHHPTFTHFYAPTKIRPIFDLDNTGFHRTNSSSNSYIGLTHRRVIYTELGANITLINDTRTAKSSGLDIFLE